MWKNGKRDYGQGKEAERLDVAQARSLCAPRRAARFNKRGWRRDLDADTFNYAVACQCAVTIEYDVNPAERQPRVSFAFCA